MCKFRLVPEVSNSIVPHVRLSWLNVNVGGHTRTFMVRRSRGKSRNTRKIGYPPILLEQSIRGKRPISGKAQEFLLYTTDALRTTHVS